MTNVLTLKEAAEKNVETNILADRIERHYCTCYACKEVTTIDFHVIIWEFKWWNNQMKKNVWEPRQSIYRIHSDGETAVKNTYIAVCPRCGAGKPKNSELKASKCKTNKNHVCDDKCQTAHSDSCTCACGGKNHGIKNKVDGHLHLF